jgi:lipopolysaccharide transport system ATP-binding protein
MYVRLAFSVAAHFNPEIMIVDEVLAVGDADFQAKCLGKMSDIASEGRTVLFVSHNMSAVTRLCERAILLEHGRIVDDGPVDEVAGRYMQTDTGTTAMRSWPDEDSAPQSEAVRLIGVRVRSREGLTTETPDIRQDIGLEVEYEIKQSDVLSPNFQLFDGQGDLAFVVNDSYYPEWGERPRSVGHWKSTCWIPSNLLSEGTYVVGVSFGTMNRGVEHLHERDVVSFQVVEDLEGGVSARGTYRGPQPGVIRPMLEWTTEQPGSSDAVDIAEGALR